MDRRDRARAWRQLTAGWVVLLVVLLAGLSATYLGTANATTPGWSFENAADYSFDPTFLAVEAGAASVRAIDQTDDADDVLGFGGGSHTETQWDATTNAVTLTAAGQTNGSGTFLSRSLDAGIASSWTSLGWTPRAPYGKPLPNAGLTETSYAERNATMAGNALLLHLDEPVSATSFADGSGTGHTGSCSGSGCPTTGDTGRFAAAATFDGSNDRIHIPSTTNLSPSGAFTLSGWLKTTGLGAPHGSMGSTPLATLEYDTTNGTDPSLKHVAGDVYALSYTGAGSDGFLTTVSIDDDGTIGTPIESLEFDPVQGLETELVHVTGDVFAIAYRGPGDDGWLATVTIAANGDIGSVVDTFEFDPTTGLQPSALMVDSDTLLVSYRGPGDDGFLQTIDIDGVGGIAAASTDSLEYDPLNGQESVVRQLDSDTVLVAYRGDADDGWLATIDVDGAGTIAAAPTDTFEFDATEGREPSLVSVGENTWAIAYRGPGADGFVTTVTADGTGAIGASAIDSLEYDPANGTEPSIVRVATETYAIAYTGVSGDGFVGTVSIDAAGLIGASLIDSLEHDPADGTDSTLLHVADDTYALAYAGTGADGFLTTVGITSTRGIEKRLAYGIDTTSNTVRATLGDTTLTTPATTGWQHIVLTYDPSLGSNQQKLYLNGTLAAQTTTTAPTLGTDALVLGNGYAGAIDETAFFARTLSATEVLNHYLRGALRMQLHVRSCNDAACSGEAFVGPDATASTAYSEAANTAPTLPSASLTGLATNRYFQYRLTLETDVATYTPALTALAIGPSHYPTTRPALRTKTGFAYQHLSGFGHTLTAGSTGTVRYQLSPNGTTYYYHAGGTWQPATDSADQANTVDEVAGAISSLPVLTGNGTLVLRIYFISDGTQPIGLESIQLDGTAPTATTMSAVPVTITATPASSTTPDEPDTGHVEPAAIAATPSDQTVGVSEPYTVAAAQAELDRLKLRLTLLTILLIVFALGMVAQAAALYYVWRLEERHHPKRHSHRTHKHRT